MRVGMLTGGGDCPGLNAVIRAVCRRLWEHGHETFGVLNGWRGMVDGTLNVLEAVRTLAPAARVLVAGSGEVFGDTGGEPANKTWE